MMNSEMPPAGIQTRPLIALVLLAEFLALCIRSWLQDQLEMQGISNSKDMSYLIVLPILLLLLAPVLRDHRGIILNKLQFDALNPIAIRSGILLGLLLRISYWGGMLAVFALSLPGRTEDIASDTAHIWFSCPRASTLALHILVLSLATPLIEETIFRGWLLHWLLPKGRWFAIVTTATLFASFHHWQSVPFAFVFGIFAAVYVLNTGSLWGALIAHATFNSLIALDWLCLRYVWLPTAQSSTTVLVGIAAFCIGTPALAISIKLVRSRVAGQEPGDKPFNF